MVRLSYHLLPFFKDHPLSEITIAEVDRYRTEKLSDGKLGPAQLNKTLKVLAMIMDQAIEHELIDRANPARGRRRRAKVSKPKRTWVEVEQLPTLLDAADRYMRPVIAVLAGAGLRNGEACALDWRDVNLATATLTVGRAKTDAGSFREVDMPGGLIEALTEWKAMRRVAKPSDPVLVTRTGRRQTETNIDHRLKAVIRRANERLAELGVEPISERVTPHSLRRSYASIRAALGDDPVTIAEQGGWTDFNFVYRTYQRAAKRREKLSGALLAEFDRGLVWAGIGQQANTSPIEAGQEDSSLDPETA